MHIIIATNITSMCQIYHQLSKMLAGNIYTLCFNVARHLGGIDCRRQYAFFLTFPLIGDRSGLAASLLNYSR